MELKDQISLYRREAGLSIDELAKKAGVPVSTVKKISAGITRDPQVETLRAIAYALGKTLDDFRDDENVTIMDYEEAQEKLRMILTEAEYAHLKAWRAADDRARSDALTILQAHRKQ